MISHIGADYTVRDFSLIWLRGNLDQAPLARANQHHAADVGTKPFGRVDETILKPALTTRRNPESAGIFLAHAVDAYLAP